MTIKSSFTMSALIMEPTPKDTVTAGCVPLPIWWKLNWHWNSSRVEKSDDYPAIRPACACRSGWNTGWRRSLPIGRIRLRQLEPWHIQRYYAEKMREGGLDSNSVHKHHILLHTALHLAFRQRILRENPVERVEAPREHPTRQFYYTPEQLRQLFRAVEGEWLEVVVKLGAYLGLRRGEICGLRHYVIRIRISRTTAGNRVVEKTPKTANSIRTLGIAGLDDLTRLLHAIRARQLELAAEQPEYQDSGYVLTDETGLPRHPNQVTKAFHQFVQRNRLPDITVHGLRHTFASLANSARIPLVDIGKALGHKDVSITGRVYTHIFDQTHQEVLNTVAARIIAG